MNKLKDRLIPEHQIIDAENEIIKSKALFDATAAKPIKMFKGYAVHGNTYVPIGDTAETLPAGRYGIQFTMDGYFPYIKEPAMEDVIELPNPIYKKVLDDLTSFWNKSDDYAKHGFIPRRGILLYGSPGNGKSCLLQVVSDRLIKDFDGIIFDVYSEGQLGGFMSVMASIRQIEPKRKVVCMMEDGENFTYGSRASSTLLNLLDGNAKINDITYIMTTNYFDQLPANIINRPSRFNRKYEIGPPTRDERSVFLSKKFPELDESTVKLLVENSDGYTIDTLKELVISTQVLGMKITDATAEIKSQFSKQRMMKVHADSLDTIADEIKPVTAKRK